jgi:hypothetical protein
MLAIGAVDSAGILRNVRVEFVEVLPRDVETVFQSVNTGTGPLMNMAWVMDYNSM